MHILTLRQNKKKEVENAKGKSNYVYMTVYEIIYAEVKKLLGA